MLQASLGRLRARTDTAQLFAAAKVTTATASDATGEAEERADRQPPPDKLITVNTHKVDRFIRVATVCKPSCAEHF